MASYGYLQEARLVRAKEKAPCAVTTEVYVLCKGFLETYVTLKSGYWFLQMRFCSTFYNRDQQMYFPPLPSSVLY